METGNMDARFSPAAAHGALPRLAIIIKLFPKAFNVIEQTNHNRFTGRLLIMTSHINSILYLGIDKVYCLLTISIVEPVTFQSITTY